MVSKVFTSSLFGIESILVEVEVDIRNGLPSFIIVGLPNKAVSESKERIISAIKNSGFSFPDKKIVVNLAPANLPKEGPSYDLPIAVGVLLATEQVSGNLYENSIILGELALDGSIRNINGVVSASLLARHCSAKSIIVPSRNIEDAHVINDVNVYGIDSLSDLLSTLRESKRQEINSQDIANSLSTNDFSEIRGQLEAKRALEIAAAGGHHILMSGPPGAGKTLLARSVPSILPKLSEEEFLEVMQIYSATNGNDGIAHIMHMIRPFRSPHHTVSGIALVGGGSIPKPGEVTLAHNGVLFLDEFPEFPPQAIECLRQPLEDRKVTISRAACSVSFPARFQLICAMNPCRCGWLGSTEKKCTCSNVQLTNYKKRLSGPILDRIDIKIFVKKIELPLLNSVPSSECSRDIRMRVQSAREIQIVRFKDLGISSNAEMSSKITEESCLLRPSSQEILNLAMEKYLLSTRGYYKVLKVARTIADLGGNSDIQDEHILEALHYRVGE